MKTPKIESIRPNCLYISTDKGKFLQSYDKIIAYVPSDGSKTVIDPYYSDYSQTTKRHLLSFLGMSSDDYKKAKKNNLFTLKSLN